MEPDGRTQMGSRVATSHPSSPARVFERLDTTGPATERGRGGELGS